MQHDSFTDDDIRKIYSLKNIAVVGMSKNPDKAAHYVPKYLIDNGYNVIPVNPTATEILGRKCYSTLLDISGPVDVVDVFRPSDQLMPVMEQAVKIKPHVIWLQEGIHNTEAEEVANKAGIPVVVFNRCMLAEHKRLF